MHFLWDSKNLHLLVQKWRQYTCLSFQVRSKANFIFYRSQISKLLHTGSSSGGGGGVFQDNYYTLFGRFLLVFHIATLKGNSRIHQLSYQNHKNYNTKAVWPEMESYELPSQTRQGLFFCLVPYLQKWPIRLAAGSISFLTY